MHATRRAAIGRCMGWLGLVPALALLVLPLLSLVHDTRWGQLSAAYGDWHAVGVSAVLSTWAMLAIVALVTSVRVVGEFGIVAVFSYFPQGIPVKLYINLQNSGIQSV